MAKAMTFVGLDVHALQTHAAVLDPATGELEVRKLRIALEEVVAFLERLGRPVRAVYEAGPTGFGLARTARERSIDVQVAAPGSIPKGADDRVKTDRRDAVRLARLLAAGELRFAFVPSLADERFRDLVRSIDDLRGDLICARHRLGKFLLRRGERYPGPTRAWTGTHLRPPRQPARVARAGDPRLKPPAGDRAASLLPRDRHALGRRPRGRSRACSPASSASSPASTPPTPRAAKARSPRPAGRTRAGCWSRPPTTTVARPASATRSPAASTAKTHA
jgi:transposase